MAQPIKTITIEGFKSIRKLDAFPLGPLNVLIGANGAGKSNFVDTLRLIRAVAGHRLQRYVAISGGADRLLHFGPEATPKMRVSVEFGVDGTYEFELEATADGKLVFAVESARERGVTVSVTEPGHGEPRLIHAPHRQYGLAATGEPRQSFDEAVTGWAIYHFHDTATNAPMRREQSARDTDHLRADGGNIAAYLRGLRAASRHAYESVRSVVRMAMPAFDDFVLRVDDPNGIGDERVRLEWTQPDSDYPFQPFQLSDGSIRFICLATALLQPNPPATMVFDEPELGLHPHALGLIGELIRKASVRTQVIVSTQSASLLNEFEPAEVVVVTSRDGASEFRRLGADELTAFLEDYSLGALWEKNYIDGAANG